jgi:hypothetical protein
MRLLVSKGTRKYCQLFPAQHPQDLDLVTKCLAKTCVDVTDTKNTTSRIVSRHDTAEPLHGTTCFLCVPVPHPTPPNRRSLGGTTKFLALFITPFPLTLERQTW